MLQQDVADDYVVATGETHSVRSFAEKVFERLEMPVEWTGSGEEEQGVEIKSGKVVIRIDPRYFRPAEVDLLMGDPAKAFSRLGWKPETSFDDLVAMMIESDMRLAQAERKMSAAA